MAYEMVMPMSSYAILFLRHLQDILKRIVQFISDTPSYSTSLLLGEIDSLLQKKSFLIAQLQESSKLIEVYFQSISMSVHIPCQLRSIFTRFILL